MRVSFCPTAVAIEDANLLGLHPDAGPLYDGMVEGPVRPPGWARDAPFIYAQPPHLYSEVMKVPIRTVVRAGFVNSGTVQEAIMEAQQGQLEYAVSALIIWSHTPAGKYVMERLDIWRIPLSEWPAVVKPWADEARRFGQVFGAGPSELGHAHALRKLSCLAGRTDADADWEKELGERSTWTNAKAAYYRGSISSGNYRRTRDAVIRDIVTSAMPALVRRGGSFGEYLQRRWLTAPHGTTSQGGEVKHLLRQLDHPELDLQLRPTKPVVFEVCSVQELLEQVRRMPLCIARGSTKPEPGLKRRALLAVDDTTAMVAGYASANIELVAKRHGMVLRQDPADVSEWVNFDCGPDVWRVSNDYTNFNMLNSVRSMQLIDLELARCWAKVGAERWARDKQAASLWVAASHAVSHIRAPVGECVSVSGLWSGHRNTARDNTVLHACYLQCVKQTMMGLFPGIRITKQRVCGDDETVAYDEWGPAVVHCFVADGLGFKSQAAKGLVSTRHDEFLQLMRCPGNIPKYPVAHTILTYCSGNWYKDPVRDLSSTIKDVSDHVWDMVLGGLPDWLGRRLAGGVLDYLMQVRDADSGVLVPLEWMAFVGNGAPGGHPLWAIETGPPPNVSGELTIAGVPSFATTDSMLSEAHVWATVPEEVRARIHRQRRVQSYRVVAKNALTSQYDAAALLVWPARQEWNTYIEPVQLTRAVVPHNRWRSVPERVPFRSARAVAISVGFPPELLGTEYMWRALTKLPPRQRSAMLAGLSDRQKPTSGWRWEVPPLLRAS